MSEHRGFVFRAGVVSALLAGIVACGGGAEPASADGDHAKESVGQAAAADTAGASFCWVDSFGRGAGAVPDECANGGQLDAGLCYSPCQSGYYGVGPVCWQSCPAGYTDDGATCRRDAQVISSDHGSCPWYDVCGVTLAKGCSHCPDGWINDGCTCRVDANIFAKSSYGRGAGAVPTMCSGGRDYDAGLCYPSCGASHHGVGPVCWGSCPSSMPYACGAGCATDANACTSALVNQITSVVQMAANIGSLVVSAGGSAAAEYSAKIAEGVAEHAAAVAALKKGLLDAGKDLTEDAAQNLAEQMVGAAENGTGIDWTQVDPTGIAAVVQAFNSPQCKDVYNAPPPPPPPPPCPPGATTCG